MHYFPYDVKFGLLAESRSFLANQKARNAIVGAENLLILNIPPKSARVQWLIKSPLTRLRFVLSKLR